MVSTKGYITQGINITTQGNANIYSTLFLDCKNFVGNGGAITFSSSLQNGIISSCSFIKCYSSYNSGSIHSNCTLLFKCSIISFTSAVSFSAAFTAKISNADLISIYNTKSRSCPFMLMLAESTISSINETNTNSSFQVSAISSRSSLLSLKFGMFENCTDGDGCSFTFYGAMNYVSYLNAIGIVSTTSRNYGLLIFGYGCQVELENSSFSHSGHPKIVSYYMSDNERITIRHCWFDSPYNTFDGCETTAISFVTNITFVPFQYSGSCLIPHKITCLVKNNYMIITTAVSILLILTS